MTKIITIGGATQDVFIQCENQQMIDLQVGGEPRLFLALQEGAKIEIQNLDYYIGGGAVNSALSFSRLGFDVGCCIKTGNDVQASEIIQRLKSMNIMPYQIVDSSLATGIAFILPTQSKDRVVLVWRGANAQLRQNDIPEQIFIDADCIYITSLSGKASDVFPSIVQHAKRLGKKVATNPGTSQLTVGAQSFVKALMYVDIFILNSDEAQLCMESLIDQCNIRPSNYSSGINAESMPDLLRVSMSYKNVQYNIRDFFRAVFDLGPQIVVVTNGKEGVYVGTKDELFFHASLPTAIVNTLGAGDAFGSCFVANILQNKDLKTATLCGLLNAQSVIEHLDANTGILSAAELAQKYERLVQQSKQQFQIFSL